MSTFIATVRTETAVYTYTAIATSSIDVIDAAIDRFGVCGVSVRPQ